MNLVKLTQSDGEPCYVNPSQVLYVERDPETDGARLYFGVMLDGVLVWIPVTERPATVQGLFLEPLR